jgi:DNA-binding protein HU-beta
MTKADLIAVMARAAGASKTSSERALDAFVAGIFDALRHDRRVTLSGFGTFVVARRAARNGRDPRTGKAITVEAHKVPRFRPSRVLKGLVR